VFVDLYLSYARLLVDASWGETQVDGLCCLTNRTPGLQEARISLIQPVFCAQTAKAAAFGLVLILGDDVRVPFDAIIKQMATRALFGTCLSLPMHVRSDLVSRRLCRAPADRAVGKPRVFEVLPWFTDRWDEAAAIVTRSTKWQSSTDPRGFTLFLFLFKRPGLRGALVNSPISAASSREWR